MAVPLLLVLGPVRRADVVGRGQDVEEGGGSPDTLYSVKRRVTDLSGSRLLSPVDI